MKKLANGQTYRGAGGRTMPYSLLRSCGKLGSYFQLHLASKLTFKVGAIMADIILLYI